MYTDKFHFLFFFLEMQLLYLVITTAIFVMYNKMQGNVSHCVQAVYYKMQLMMTTCKCC